MRQVFNRRGAMSNSNLSHIHSRNKSGLFTKIDLDSAIDDEISYEIQNDIPIQVKVTTIELSDDELNEVTEFQNIDNNNNNNNETNCKLIYSHVDGYVSCYKPDRNRLYQTSPAQMERMQNYMKNNLSSQKRNFELVKYLEHTAHIHGTSVPIIIESWKQKKYHNWWNHSTTRTKNKYLVELSQIELSYLNNLFN